MGHRWLNGGLTSWTLYSESVVTCISDALTDGWLGECMYEQMIELVNN